MFVVNTAVNLRIFRGRYHFTLHGFASTGKCFYHTFDTKKYYPRCYKVNYAETFRSLSFYTSCLQIICILQIDSFILGLSKSCWFSVLHNWIWWKEYEIICVRSVSFAKSQQAFKIEPVNIVKITQLDVNKKNICWYGNHYLP